MNAPTPATTAPYVEAVLNVPLAEGPALPGVLCRPAAGAATSGVGVLVIVGGPQYRVGSHRQFVQLARHLASCGHAVLRFDVRGMGDAAGPMRTFEDIGTDIGAALQALAVAAPEAPRLVVWGLCDAASAALMHAVDDARLAGLVLANPWVRSVRSLAEATVKHYYRQRLWSRELWLKVLRGDFAWRASLGTLWRNLQAARGGTAAPAAGPAAAGDFRDRMLAGLGRFRGPVLVLLSSDDLTAREFEGHVAAHPDWARHIAEARVQRVDLRDADHTFSRRAGREAAQRATQEWIQRAVCRT